jgi:6,7-dimethyl-8-ribityllumazine synthase
MSNALQPKPRVFGQKVRICVIASKFNEKFTDPLVDHMIEELREVLPMSRVDLIRVGGAFEIPVTAAKMLEHDMFNCVIALGVIIRGETGHADLIASSVTNALQGIAVQHRTPVIHEVLLLENETQAHARCIGSAKNRGREAARAAANIIEVFAEITKAMPLEVNRKAK